VNAADLPLLLVLPALLIASAFFSGTETALFGLTQRERVALVRQGGVGARSAIALLTRPRTLLITLLLGNMVINVFYFVISSVLLLRAEGAGATTALTVGPLLALILFGEVLPKLTAGAHRVAWCRVASPPMLAVHRAIGPLRDPLESLVIAPLSRLIRPSRRDATLSTDELSELLDASRRAGAIDAEEANLLDAVADLGVIRVRDIMRPRVDMAWLPEDATRRDALALLEREPGRIVAVCRGTLDGGVAGVLALKRLLAAPAGVRAGTMMVPALFVPATAPLDRLLDLLRVQHRRSAVVVDEFGGVVGFVTIADVVDRLAKSFRGGSAGGVIDDDLVQPVRDGVWRVSGRLNVHDWADAFAVRTPMQAATVGGVIVGALGRLARPGDTVTLGPLAIVVEAVEGGAVRTALVSVAGGAPADDAQGATP
jgi:CBS domain containing-hemolysin-like protein